VALRPPHAIVALGAVALGILTERAGFMPPYSILLWIVAAVAPDEWRNAAALACAALVALLFAAWCVPLVRGRTRLSAVAYVPLCALSVAVAGYFALTWEHGVRYQGRETVHLLLALNAAPARALLGMAYHNRRRPDVTSAFAFRWVLLAWFVTIAFPWLGESL